MGRRQVVVDPGYDIAFDNPAEVSSVVINGLHESLGTTILDLTLGGNVTLMTDKAGLEIVSDSANDKGTATAGTGARTVVIEYLDNNYAPKTETVTLNGTGVVTTTNLDYFRVNRMYVASAGTGGVAAGNITLRGLTGGATQAYIQAGFNDAVIGMYTVPAGKTFTAMQFVTDAGKDAATVYGRFRVMANQLDGAKSTLYYQFFEMMSNVMKPFVPQVFAEKVTVKLRGKASAASTIAIASLQGFLK